MKNEIRDFFKKIKWDDILLVLILILALVPIVGSHPQILLYLAIAGLCMYLSKHL